MTPSWSEASNKICSLDASSKHASHGYLTRERDCGSNHRLDDASFGPTALFLWIKGKRWRQQPRRHSKHSIRLRIESYEQLKHPIPLLALLVILVSLEKQAPSNGIAAHFQSRFQCLSIDGQGGRSQTYLNKASQSASLSLYKEPHRQKEYRRVA